MLAHAVRDQVCAGIQQDRAADLIGPVVVVSHSAQAGFYAADDDGRLLECPADEIAIDDNSVIRALSDDTARAVRICAAAFPGDGIVIDHGIHVAG